TALSNQSQYTDAIPHYEAYLRVHQDDAGAWASLGMARASVDRTDGAIEAFRAALNIEPRNRRYRRNLATALLERGNLAEAADNAANLLADGPTDSDAHELMGRVRASQGNVEAARREFEQALQLSPDNALARQELAMLVRK